MVRLNENNREVYFEIDYRKFKVERITEKHYELTVFEDGKFFGTYNFTGSLAYEEALAEILSYSEITDDDYNA